jgi:antirestriction protein ArdC
MKLNTYVESKLQEIVDQMVASLEKGDIPWHKSWSGASMIPNNWFTGNEYSFMNGFIMMMQGYGDTRWAGPGQIRKGGGTILPGLEKKGTAIFAPILKGYWYTDDEGNSRKGKKLIGYKIVWAFNAEQCDGIPALPVVDDIDPTVGYERAAALVEASGIKVTHQGNRACYSPKGDSITMPPAGAFTSLDHYWATLMHELTHATGHSSRLDRKGLGSFKTHSDYAFEELVAEMGSAFLCHIIGIDRPDIMQNHEAYIGSWIRALKRDPQVLLEAAGQARKAIGYIVELEK